jgi:ribose 5-phosphate isomerase B
LENDLKQEKYQTQFDVTIVGGSEGDVIEYPQVAAMVAEMVQNHQIDYGVLICGTGIGMCVVANKFAGIRAAPCHNTVTAEMSRRHNDANIICLSGSLLGEETCIDMVHQWLATSFEGERHQRRLDKLNLIEERVLAKT